MLRKASQRTVFKYERRERLKKIFDQVDWSMSNAEIAAKYQISASEVKRRRTLLAKTELKETNVKDESLPRMAISKPDGFCTMESFLKAREAWLGY